MAGCHAPDYPDSVQIGPYNVLSEIARGGMGVVYRAHDAQGNVVALKLLLAQHTQDPTIRQRFQAEIKALARLRHPHVVAIRSAGEQQGAPWLAMDFVEGESLEDRLRQGPLAIEDAVRLVRQLAQALSYVHTCGVLHRDLKPDNVLLRGDDALLTDFGLVLDTEASLSRLTATGVLQGTPGYWSPEQARGQIYQIGPATDVYGLGAVLYACLTGQPPIQGGSIQEHLLWVSTKVKVPPRTRRPEVPGWLSELCMNCLSVQPGDRPSSADDVARALLRSDGQNRGRTHEMRGLAAGLGALCALSLVALGAWTLWPGSLPAASEPEASKREPLQPDAPQPDPAPEDVEPDPTDGETSTPDRGPGAVELVLVGEAHFQADRHAEAIEAFDRVLELEPYAGATLFAYRGASKAFLRRDAEAVEDFGRALALQPLSAGVHSSRGISRFRLARYAEAVADFDRALELGGLAQSVLDVVDQARAEAVAKLRAVRGDSDPLTVGEAHFRAGRYVEGIEAYSEALDLDSRSENAYLSRGVCKAKLGRDAEAIEDYDRALELSPRYALAYVNRGGSKARIGRDAEAIEDYDRALELKPNRVGTHLNRGISRFRLGRYAEAIEDLDRALELGVDASTAKLTQDLRAQAIAKLEDR